MLNDLNEYEEDYSNVLIINSCQFQICPAIMTGLVEMNRDDKLIIEIKAGTHPPPQNDYHDASPAPEMRAAQHKFVVSKEEQLQKLKMNAWRLSKLITNVKKLRKNLVRLHKQNLKV